MWILIAVLVFLAVVIAVYSITVNKLVSYAFRRTEKDGNMWDTRAEYADKYDPSTRGLQGKYAAFDENIYNGTKWIFEKEPEDVSITSYDGLKLAGHYIDVPDKKCIILMVHGFRSCGLFEFSCVAKWYHDHGCAMLLVDHRAHNCSEGKYRCFGVRERYDIRDWAVYLNKRFPGVPVIFDGVSMGASTVMMAAGLELPENVRAIIADCGYTTPYDIFDAVMRPKLGALTVPVLNITDAVLHRRLGFRFKECDTRVELKKCKLPVIIAHGTGDTFVPCRMSCDNYEATKDGGNVTLLLAEGAEHGLSYMTIKDRYTAEIVKLIERCSAENT